MIKTIIVLVLLTATTLQSRGPDRKTTPILPEVTARGQALFEYDQTAWHGTDAMFALRPPKDFNPQYIARKSDNGWNIVFGVLSEQRDRFVIVYEATQGKTLREFTAKKLDPPREDTGYYLAAAKALRTALLDFAGDQRPYNVAVLPASDERFYVYVYPAQVKSNVYPLGGDVRYLIASGGDSIVEKRQLHKSIIELPPASIPKGASVAGGFHSHVLSDVPEDTDVFHVLSRQPSRPEFIGTPNNRFFEIAEDGTIREGRR